MRLSGLCGKQRAIMLGNGDHFHRLREGAVQSIGQCRRKNRGQQVDHGVGRDVRGLATDHDRDLALVVQVPAARRAHDVAAVRAAVVKSLAEGVSLSSLGAWRFHGLPEPT